MAVMYFNRRYRYIGLYQSCEAKNGHTVSESGFVIEGVI
jgi:hypothetical protein